MLCLQILRKGDGFEVGTGTTLNDAEQILKLFIGVNIWVITLIVN